MLSIRKIVFFMHQYSKQLKKKWGSLLLLFLFPIVLIGLVLTLVAGLLLPKEDAPIRVALVDEDETKETLMFSGLLEETASDNQIIQIISIKKDIADKLMKQNEISAYFSFPEGFTADLYEGESVTIPIVGNPLRSTESYLVKELVESLTRYIGTAQANILTIHDYAKKTAMPKEMRQDMMFQQFMDFVLFTLGKDKLLDEEVITNVATSSPTHYYILSGWFIAFSVWLFAIFNYLGKEEDYSMLIRMKLFGVNAMHRIVAKILVSLGYILVIAIIVFLITVKFVDFELYAIDYLRISFFAFFYALLFLIGIALIEFWVTLPKVVLLLQSLYTFILIFTSGAIIPTLYFPQVFQETIPYFFSYESLNWMIDIVLEGRNYADFTTLIVYSALGILILWLSFVVKERWIR